MMKSKRFIDAVRMYLFSCFNRDESRSNLDKREGSFPSHLRFELSRAAQGVESAAVLIHWVCQGSRFLPSCCSTTPCGFTLIGPGSLSLSLPSRPGKRFGGQAASLKGRTLGGHFSLPQHPIFWNLVTWAWLAAGEGGKCSPAGQFCTYQEEGRVDPGEPCSVNSK